jgi:hypothetical protein
VFVGEQRWTLGVFDTQTEALTSHDLKTHIFDALIEAAATSRALDPGF